MTVEEKIKILEDALCKLLKDDNYDKKRAKSIRYKITCLKRYGVTNPYYKDEFKNKAEEKRVEYYKKKGKRGFASDSVKRTLERRYGAKNPANSKVCREKRESTMKERYNVNVPCKSALIRKRQRNTVISRYRVIDVSKVPSIKRKIKESKSK